MSEPLHCSTCRSRATVERAYDRAGCYYEIYCQRCKSGVIAEDRGLCVSIWNTLHEVIERDEPEEEPKPGPCPFCGGDSEIHEANSDGILCVRCTECLSRSAIAWTPEECIEAWAKRAQK